jgi:glycerophosphoryl diester phosphodiesterase
MPSTTLSPGFSDTKAEVNMIEKDCHHSLTSEVERVERVQVPTVEEYIDVALSAPRTVGIYLETKHPTWHNQLPPLQGTSMEDLLVEVLSAKGYRGAVGTEEWDAQPCFIQSFEV